MQISLKEISQFFLDLVNKTFIPLINSSNIQHQKVLQIWKQASCLLSQIQKKSYWDLQSFLRNINVNQALSDGKQIKQYIKNESIRSNTMAFLSYDSKFDRKKHPYQAYNHQQSQKNAMTIKSISREHSETKNKPYKYSSNQNQIKNQYQNKSNLYENKNNVKAIQIKDDNTEGFQKLIQSFRKLVNNFESNHKKLLREDQNYKQNYKEGFLSTH